MPAGTAAPMLRTGSAGMDGLKREKTARERTPEPKNEKSIANRRQNNKQSPFVSRFPRQITLRDDRGADDSDSVQRSEAQQLQFKENIGIPASAQRE